MAGGRESKQKPSADCPARTPSARTSVSPRVCVHVCACVRVPPPSGTKRARQWQRFFDLSLCPTAVQKCMVRWQHTEREGEKEEGVKTGADFRSSHGGGLRPLFSLFSYFPPPPTRGFVFVVGGFEGCPFCRLAGIYPPP